MYFMKFDVKLNAKRNIIFGVINKIVLMILPFVVKATINNILGVEYLGLNSLFASILQVLLLSELGFSSALVYHMYKPIAENDQKTINALLNLYRKAYFVIGIVIMLLGLMVMPALPNLTKGNDIANININVIYIFQLSNAAISYFLFGYKQALLVAYQREDINSIINLATQLGLQGVQIALLYATQNYYLYVACMPVFTLLNNIWIGIITKKMFPSARGDGNLEQDVLKSIKKLVAGTFIQKACAVTRNSLDSICISAFVGLALTGIYNNYYTILSGITTMLGIIGTSLFGGIGNHVAIKTRDQNFEELEKLDFLYMNISSWITICLLCVYQPFMKLWMGESMMLPMKMVILFCIYFYLLKMGDMRSLYSAANGLWWKMRYRSVLETVLNIGLNVCLGLLYGVEGIILATIISLFLCNFLWSTSILFSDYFGKHRLREYFIYHIKYAVFTASVCVVAYLICSIVNVQGIIFTIIIRGAICTICFLLAFFLINWRKSIFSESLTMVRK